MEEAEETGESRGGAPNSGTARAWRDYRTDGACSSRVGTEDDGDDAAVMMEGTLYC